MKNYIKWALFCQVLFLINKAMAQVNGTKTIPGNYATIAAALADIQNSGLSGHVILELQQNYNFQNEPDYPFVIAQNFPSSANATVTLRPSIGARGIYVGTGVVGGIVPATGSNPIFDIYGAFFKIDGRPGGIGTLRELYIWSNGVQGSAIQFSNNANNNTVSYCHLIGTNFYADPYTTPLNPKGVITFNPAAGSTTGIANNTVQKNIIEGAIFGGGPNGPTIVSPVYGIYAKGNSVAPNVNNKIIDNNIINVTYSGIEIAADGPGAGWVIKNNSFYSTLAGYTYPEYSINIQQSGYKAGTNIIEGNFIGGNGPLATGKWLGGPRFGIVCNSNPGGDSVSIRNNTFKNIEKISQVAFSPYRFSEFIAIAVTNNGAPNKVHCTNNFIGGTTSDFGISLTSLVPGISGNDANFYGILYSNCGSGALSQNTIQNIRLTAPKASNFLGIKAAVLTNVDISQNAIQQLNVQAGGKVWLKNFVFSDEEPFLQPCNQPLPTPPLASNNTATSITASANELEFTGISINNQLVKYIGNTIGSATAVNSINLSGANVLADGVLIKASPANAVVANTVVSNITATGTSGAVLNGIRFNGTGAVKISGSNIKNLSAGTARAIHIETLPGVSSATVTNNTVKGTITHSGVGIEVQIPAGATTNFMATHNTVSNFQTGFVVNNAAGSTYTQQVEANSITGNTMGYRNQSLSSSQTARCNWWGSASGPGGAGQGTGDPVSFFVVFSPWATTPTLIGVDAGPDQTIYTGYGPASARIAPVYSLCSATPPYSYLWSTGATTQTITVSPTVTTTFRVTVRDASGKSATDSIIVFVKDIRCGNNMVKICHKINATRKQTQCVNTSDVPTHLAHGDALGECPSAAARFANTQHENVYEKLFFVYPNPASDKMVLQWAAEKKGMALIKITDMAGRPLIQQTVHESKGNNQKELPLRRLEAGNYILIMQAGGEMHTVKFMVAY